MKLHEIETLEKASFQRMKVESGYMYNAWNVDKQDWNEEWIFVPEASERVKYLEHHYATTIGLYATDRPDLINDPNNLLFEIKA